MAFPTRYVNLIEARRRFGARVDRVAPFFGKSDPLADAVIESIGELTPARGWRMLEHALSHGISSVPDAPSSFHALFAELDSPPAWVDDETLDRGGALLMRAGVIGGIVLGAKSLVLGYASPAGNKPLAFSGRLVGQASRRLNETSRFVQAVCRPGGMRRFSDGFQITVKVRLMHAQVRHMLLKSGKWQSQHWGLPINQHDMAGTTLLFSLSVIEGLRAFGLKITREEVESYMQLWRYVGRIIGVDADILPTSEFDAWQLAQLIECTMGEPDDDSRALVKALFEHPMNEARSERQKGFAEKQALFGYGICRSLLGDELADKLAVPRNSYRFALPTMRAFVTAAENVRIRSAWADRTALATGRTYWDKVVELGLAGATAEFRLPERLAIA